MHRNPDTQKRIAEARALLFGNDEDTPTTKVSAPTPAPAPRTSNIGEAADVLYKRFGNASEAQIMQRLLESSKDAESIDFWQQISPSRIKTIQAAIDHVVSERRKRLRINEIERELQALKKQGLK